MRTFIKPGTILLMFMANFNMKYRLTLYFKSCKSKPKVLTEHIGEIQEYRPSSVSL